jgi:hypothetical protein
LPPEREKTALAYPANELKKRRGKGRKVPPNQKEGQKKNI